MATSRLRFGAATVLTLLLSLALLPLSALPAAADSPPPASTTYPDAVLADHPVQYLRLGDSQTSATAIDSSSFGHDGTYASGISAASGAITGDTDGAISGAGYLVGGTITGLPIGSEPRTLETWFRTSHNDDWQTILRYGDGSVDLHSRFQVVLHNNGFLRVHSDDATFVEFRLPRPVSDSAWHLYDVTYDGAIVTAYMDGQPAGSAALAAVTTGTTGLRVGNYNGDYDEVAVYPSALNNKQIETHWTRGNSSRPTCVTTPTTGYGVAVVADHPNVFYRLGDQTTEAGSRVAFDSSGNCNNGALTTSAVAQSDAAIHGDADKATSNNGVVVATGSREALPSGNSARTLETWFRTTHNDDWQTILRYGDGSVDPHSRFQVVLHNSGFLRVHSDDATLVQFQLPRPVSDGAWHLYDVTYDGTTVTAYMDGQPVGSAPLVVDTKGAGGLQVGNYNGDYDEVAVYPSALSNGKIENHWTRGNSTRGACVSKPTSGYGAAIVANSPSVYYRLGDNTTEPDSRVAFDSSGNCNNGALTTSATAQSDAAIFSDSDRAVSSNGVVAVTGSRETLPSGNASRTLETWFRTTHNDDWQTILRYADGSADAHSRFQVVLHNSGFLRVHSDDATFVQFQLPRPVSDSVWHLYDVTYAGGVVTAYMDGQPVGSALLAVDTKGAGGLQVGNYNGDYDEVAVYPSALNNNQIENHWTQGGSARGACTQLPTTPYGSAIVADGPNVYYRLGDQTAEPGSRVAFDSSGGCNNAALTSSAVAQSDSAIIGDSDKAASSNGGVLAATGSGAALPSGSNSRTLETWFRTSHNDDWQTVLRYGDGSADAHSRFQVVLHNSGFLRVHSDDNTLVQFQLPRPVSDGAWHLYDVTYVGGVITAYMDGQPVGSAPLAVDTKGSGGLQIGNYNGDYDEVAVFPTALNNKQLESHWTLGTSTHGSCIAAPSTGYSGAVTANGPNVYYRLGDQSAEPGSRTAFDSSGNCNNGAYSTAAATQSDAAILGDADKAASSNGNVLVTGSGAALPSGNAQRTLETWFRTTHQDDWQTVLSYGNGSADPHSRFQVVLHNSGFLRVHSDDNTLVQFQLPHPVSDGAWHLYDVTYDGTSITAYMDGQAVGSAPLAVDTKGAGGLQIGNYNGDYDEVAVYPTALSASTISGLWSKHFEKPPNGAQAVSATAGSNNAGITWTAADGNGQPITSYVVTAIDGGRRGPSVATAGDVLNARIDGLVKGHTYTFEVVASNGYGPGAPSLSNAVTITSGSASTYASTVLSDSPSNYYRYSEASGGVLADSSSNNRTGSYADLASIARGVASGIPHEADPSATLNGPAASIASTFGDGLPAGNSARTFETWVRTTNTGSIGGWGTADTDHGFIVDLTASGLAVRTGSASNSFSFSSPLTDNRWHHVVVTFDGNRALNVYVGGVLAGSTTLAAVLNTTAGALYLGGFPGSTSAVRTLDETAIYGHVLDASAVARHYAQAIGGDHAPNALLEVNPSTGTTPFDIVATLHAFDSDADAMTYTLDFGDGTVTQPAPISSIASAIHRYVNGGQYIARLRVTDGWLVSESSVPVTVHDFVPNDAPTLDFGIDDATGVVPFTVPFTVDARDPEGDALTYSMDFGDGATSTGAVPGIPLSHTYTHIVTHNSGRVVDRLLKFYACGDVAHGL